MTIVPLLLLCSLALVAGSIVLFVFSARQGDCHESDRICLLPLEDDTEVLYQMSHHYVPEAARGVRWDDPALEIDWPPADRRFISERDRAWPDLSLPNDTRPTASSRSAASRTTA